MLSAKTRQLQFIAMCSEFEDYGWTASVTTGPNDFAEATVKYIHYGVLGGSTLLMRLNIDTNGEFSGRTNWTGDVPDNKDFPAWWDKNHLISAQQFRVVVQDGGNGIVPIFTYYYMMKVKQDYEEGRI